MRPHENPYTNRTRLPELDQSPDEREADRRDAPGFNAMAIDGMLRDAYAAGLEAGRRDKEQFFAEIWEQGFVEGRRVGAEAARGEIGKKLYQAATHKTGRRIEKAEKARTLAEVREALADALEPVYEIWRELGAP